MRVHSIAVQRSKHLVSSFHTMDRTKWTWKSGMGRVRFHPESGREESVAHEKMNGTGSAMFGGPGKILHGLKYKRKEGRCACYYFVAKI